MGKLYRLDDEGKLHLDFHWGQSRIWDCQKRFILALSGTRSGKTSLSPFWLWREILNTYEPGGSNDYLAITATNALFNNAFLPAMIEVFVDVLGIGYFWGSTKTMELKCLDPNDPKYNQFYQGPTGRSFGTMWGRIIFHSAQGEGSLESMTAKAVVMDEFGLDSFTEEHWEAINRRISIGQRRVLGTTTPYNLGWIYQTLYQQWLNGDPDVEIIQFPSYLNPDFPMEEYERAKRTMPEWRFKMFYDGTFIRPPGQIYHNYDDRPVESGGMVVEDFPIPLSWETVVGVDFGGANTATVWLAFNPDDGRWYLFRETIMGHMPTRDHVAIAKQFAQGRNNLTAVGGTKAEGQQRDDWWREGFYVEEPPVLSIEPGISRVIALLQQDKLRVFRSCTKIRRDFGNYRRKLDSHNEPTEQIIAKSDHHILDAIRYASTWIDPGDYEVSIQSYADFTNVGMKGPEADYMYYDRFLQMVEAGRKEEIQYGR